MDVYSFGLIMWELYHTTVPFDGDMSNCIMCVIKEDLRPEIKLIKDHESEDDSRHADTIVGDCSISISDLIRRCWLSDPSQRPDFNTILSILWQETV